MSAKFRVVVAPDKFKGSLRADEVADAITGVVVDSPGVEVVQHPVADGGEGTVDLALATGFAPVTVTVAGPLGEPVSATFAVRDRVAVIEMASAAGLGLVPTVDPSTARSASTYGVGELIVAALDLGVTRIVVGVGGSATTDGGRGALEALGVDRTTLGPAGRDPRLRDVDLVVACDVDNPLLGPHGAAAVYAPQKGADERGVVDLEERLTRWADAVAEATGKDLRDEPGVGAAGGLAFGLVAVAGAHIVSGVELLLELTGFDAVVAGADLVIVGEGSLDTQSLRGKGPVGVARAAARTGTDVIAVAGRNLLSDDEVRGAGLRAVYALGDVEPDPAICMRDARRLLVELTRVIAAERLPTGAAVPQPLPPTAAEYRAAMLGTVVEE